MDWQEKLPFAVHVYITSIRTSADATKYWLIYKMEVVLPVEDGIPSLRILMEAQIKEAEGSEHDATSLIL